MDCALGDSADGMCKSVFSRGNLGDNIAVAEQNKRGRVAEGAGTMRAGGRRQFGRWRMTASNGGTIRKNFKAASRLP